MTGGTIPIQRQEVNREKGFLFCVFCVFLRVLFQNTRGALSPFAFLRGLPIHSTPPLALSKPAS
jgi:hypothetical protein